MIAIGILTVLTALCGYVASPSGRDMIADEMAFKYFGFLTVVLGIWDLTLMIQLLIK